ncbi:hypothetical protein D16iCDA_15655 [Pseudomonas seleniipraecipitans]|uniref:KTSC domain-containing protein n=1 Tax=Phytopseudomonas seleniipraecipitans TaxID=640205 RepID=A0ABY5J4Y0_9GAMM|nr:hypothetical protein [Pseudomonas seleniipraecipitans]UUD63123.1 hypothetical protein D16iCDA_15655 [Pseudomonas seleniipraecipitans]
MERYRNLGGDSAVIAYEIAAGSITVEFANGRHRFYLYKIASTGAAQIEEMQRLARAGQGLNSYIGRVVRTGYERRW